MDDWELLRRYRDGETGALEAVIQRHALFVYATACRLVGEADGPDLVQAVFILLMRKAGFISERGTVVGWLHQTTRRCAANFRRMEGRRRRHEGEAALSRPEARSCMAEEDLGARIDDALAGLSARHRDVILLHWLEGKTFVEAGAAMNVTEEAARKLAGRAIEKLRRRLGGRGGPMDAAGIVPYLIVQRSATTPEVLRAALSTIAHGGVPIAAAVGIAGSTMSLKGGFALMAMTKLQVAAVAVVAAMVVMIPVAAVVFRGARGPVSGAGVPASAPASAAGVREGDPMAEDSRDYFNATYGLAPGQILRHVPDIDPQFRVTLLRKYGQMGVSRDSHDIVFWRKGEVLGTGALNYPTYPLQNFATDLFRVQFASLEGDLAHMTMSGDFSASADKGTTPEAFIAPFTQILQDDFHVRATVEFRDVPRKVIVLRGHWSYTPSPDFPEVRLRGNDGKPAPCVSFYGGPQSDFYPTQTAVYSGGADTFAGTISWFLHEPVMWEADGIPENIGMREPAIVSYDDIPSLSPAGKNAVLDHLTQQTGITWSEETRTVRHLFIASAK